MPFPRGRDRQRYMCKECGESGICEHGGEAAQSVNGLRWQWQHCEHVLQRSWDKACGGSCFCEHEDRYRTFVFVL